MLTIYGGGDTVSQMIFNYSGGRLKTRSGNPPEVNGKGTWKSWKEIPYMEDVNALQVTRGSNANGEWVRFPDGTQICWKWGLDPGTIKTNNKSGGGANQGTGWRSSNISWKFPASFGVGEVASFATSRTWYNWATGNGVTNSSAEFIQWAMAEGNATKLDVMAIGRWK